MKNTKKILSVFLTLMMIISIIPMSTITAFAEDTATSGTCGDNLTWNFDESTGTLTISGTGTMSEYSYYKQPWKSYIESTKKLIITDGVTSIGKNAFYDFGSLTSVTIPDSVATIGDYAFYSCDNLTSVRIGNGVTTIGNDVFGMCLSITSITVDSNSNYFSSDGYGTLFNKDKTTLIQYPTGNTRTSYTIPSSVTTIAENAFNYCDSITSVIIPDSVATIGDYAFFYCTSLTSVTIPDGVTTIGSYAFSCASLTSVTIPDSVTTIENCAFYCCSGLKSVTIPDSVTEISYGIFADCISLENITIPVGVTSIGSEAFAGCTSLKNITIPDSITTIGPNAFVDTAYYNDESNWHNGVLYLDDWIIMAKTDLSGECNIKKDTRFIATFAFFNCTSITSITIPDGITSIPIHTFVQCSKLESITIPDSVTSIGPEAVYNCPSLTDIYYSGTQEQWNAITIGDYNDELLNALLHCNSDFHTHSYSETVITQPTCTEEGECKYTCECGDSYIGILEALDHDYSKVQSETKPATCLEEGYITYECSRCNENMKVMVPPIGHTESCYEENYVGGTCEEYSSYDVVYYCTVCGVELNRETITSEKGNHSYEASVTQSTCLTRGYTIYTCTICGDTYTSDYIDPTGHKTSTIVLVTATCKQQGMQYDYCEECGETLSDVVYTAKKDHILGEWEITVEATCTTNGEKVQKCTVCGDVINRETILATGNNETGNDKVVDDETGVELEYPKNKYDGDVDIIVEETIDETAFNLVDTKTNASNVKLYNIKMTVDGVETQPNGTVTIRIPLPAGFSPESSYIIYVDTVTGNVEKIETTYENGYLVFETTHFSYYAVVEEGNYTFSIQSPSRTEIRNKDGIILHANVEGNAPVGSYVRWESSNGNFDKSADGSNLKIIANNKGWTTFTAILCDADGNELARDTVDMYSKSGFFDKIGGFFRSLFGTTKVYDA